MCADMYGQLVVLCFFEGMIIEGCPFFYFPSIGGKQVVNKWLVWYAVFN